ncbi:MAG: hypothetical protein Sylvanvirus20_13 [Sylvanvirus sp.]|uniref:Peptidase C1A papain C-terminal domain-containing protein n=1 Tax=Sylvanvirus sp. TaxID=2487774 RepID=A0A3G5AIL6_9VIRU|nr:MAG: hypothetical protein Sylvanvirus20_13 [Sylvanvirus sp.]
MTEVKPKLFQSLKHGVNNTASNLKRDLEWNWKKTIAQPWHGIKASVKGRGGTLPPWQTKQKSKLKQLWIQEFNKEEEDAVPIRQEAKRQELQNGDEKLTDAQIKKIVSKIKKNKFHDEKSEVNVVLYNKRLFEFVEEEKLISAGLPSDKFDHHLKFVRNGRVIRLFESEDFFKTTDPTITMTWSKFKSDVFYKYMDDSLALVRAAEREKRIVRLTDLAWHQLSKEYGASAVTYDLMKKRLQSFDHALDPSFFEEAFWSEKGDQVIATKEDLQIFKEEDCRIGLSHADAKQLVKDLLNEQELKFDATDLTLGTDAIGHDEKASQPAPKSPSTKKMSLGSRILSRMRSKKSLSGISSNRDEDASSQEKSAPSRDVSPSRSTSSSDPSKGSDDNEDEDKDEKKQGNPTVVVVPAIDTNITLSSVLPVVTSSTDSTTSTGPVDSALISIAVDPLPSSILPAVDVLPGAVPLPIAGSYDVAQALNHQDNDSKLDENSMLSVEGKHILTIVNADLAKHEQASATYLWKLSLSTQVQLEKATEDIDHKVFALKEEARKKTTGIVFATAATIAERKKDYANKIAIVMKHQSEFQSDESLITDYLKGLYRAALSRHRSSSSAQDVATGHGSWKDMLEEHGQDMLDPISTIGTTSSKLQAAAKAKSNVGASLLDDPLVLPVTLEESENFTNKRSLILYSFHQTKHMTKDMELPSCVDYSSELPPCEPQQQTHPGCIDSICLLKEWQEYKNYGFKSHLSKDFLCDSLKATHNKNPKAQNVTVHVSVFDALALVCKHGLPTKDEYVKYMDRSKSKTAHWLREHAARFKVSCRKHMLDRVLLVRDLFHVRLALARYGPLLCSIPVGTPEETRFWMKEKKGYHTLLIVGYDQQSETFLLRNTVGSEYGDFGFVRVSYKTFVEYNFHVLLCIDQTRPKYCGRIQSASADEATNSPHVHFNAAANSTDASSASIESEHKLSGASAPSPTSISGLAEDNLIRDAKKKAFGLLQARGGAFRSFESQVIQFIFPSSLPRIVNPSAPVDPLVPTVFNVLKPGQTGVALIAFTGVGAVVPWTASVGGYLLFVDQTTNYIAGIQTSTVFQVHVFTDPKAKWTPSGTGYSSSATLQVLNVTSRQIEQTQTVQVVVDASTQSMSIQF